MRTTRSSTRAAAANGDNAPTATFSSEKRKVESEATPDTNKKRKHISKATSAAKVEAPSLAIPEMNSNSNPSIVFQELVPAILTFSFEDAKQHLISVDHRFEDLFSNMECKPFQRLEVMHPFRALVTSIIGQQISGMAARSINHRFRKLYDPSLPEKPAEDHKSPTSSFPNPGQVAVADINTLRSAGLSARKAEYIQDLALRFADGRLSTQKLLQADDSELARMLLEVRGIGRWTVDMFAMFSLRRPDILPVGDLGVQRGLLKWFLSLHSPDHNYGISPQKAAGQSTAKEKQVKVKKAVAPEDKDGLPVFEAPTSSANSPDKVPSPDVSSLLPIEDESAVEIPSIPPPFTPSIVRTLNKPGVNPGSHLTPLPDGLSVAILKSRLDGKKKIKGAFLTPKEMEDLTEQWKPYRSIGVYYMWSLAQVSES